jgi:hypothetical protein
MTEPPERDGVRWARVDALFEQALKADIWMLRADDQR